MANTKLSQEELQQIQDIQQRMNLAQQELGKLELHKIEIQNYVAQTRQIETSLVKALEDKYGQGSIDLEKGEFIPAEQPDTKQEKVAVPTVE